MASRQDPEPSDGKVLGCVAAVLFSAGIGFVLLFAMAWGGAHCEPVPACQRDGAGRFLLSILVLLVVASVLGLIVRYLVRFVARRLHEMDGMIVGLINLIVMALVLWLALEATQLIAFRLL